jgi:hypothetical protein
MSRLHWIVIGILGGTLYSWLITATFERTYAIAWPEWYRVFAEDHQVLAIRLWDIASWLPAVPIALLMGYLLIKILHRAAIPAAIVGALVTFVYGSLSSAGSGWVYVGNFIFAGLLPVSAFVLGLYNKSFKSDTGSAGAA